MILPSKHLAQERSLLTLGAWVLERLDRPKTVSELWGEMRLAHADGADVPFDWFVLSLDLLAAVRTVRMESGRIQRVRP